MTGKKKRTKKDRYLKARGGSSAYLNIYCAKCQTPILLYQKDGPGLLYRMYLDRILAPAKLAQLQHECTTKADVPDLVCPQCGALIAVPMVYAPEKRLALRVIRGAHVKHKGNGTFPPEG